MSERANADVGALLQMLVQQQTAVLEVQAESLRLQRVLVEHLLGAPNEHTRAHANGDIATPAQSSAITDVSDSTAVLQPASFSAADRPDTSQVAEPLAEDAGNAAPAQTEFNTTNGVASPAGQNAARGARYYQPRSSITAKVIQPEVLELMRRLQEIRGAGDLILQFGPHKGTTLAQVALDHPDYVRQLVTRAQRPDVRAAAGRVVQALDAAAEHKRRTTRGGGRRRPSATERIASASGS
jgi:hypothetical protein